MMKITVACVAAFLLAGTSLSYSESVYVPGQPSIDCAKARSTVATILCSVSEAAAADWDVNAATWALYFSVNESQRRIVDADQQRWRQSLDSFCALPRQQTPEDRASLAMAHLAGRMMLGPGFNVPGPQPITRAHERCLINAYHARTAMLRSKLSGDALAEARLSTEQRVKLQEALADKGFLRPDQVGPGTHDGEFGPITRKAIKQFQGSLGAFPSGFLTSDQRFALLERPEERKARIARGAAEAKERDAQIEAERRAAEAAAKEQAKRDAEQKRLEAQAATDAKAERDAAERRAAEAAAKEQAKQDAEQKRLEAEAEAAKEWARRLDEARKKGPQYVAQVGLKWSLSEKQNPMTDDNDYTVTSVQPNGMGAEAFIEGTCQKGGRAVFLATLNETDDQKTPLALPTFQNGAIVGDKRINDEPVFPTALRNDRFKNRIVVTTLSSLDPAESIETTWRVLAQVETSRGPILVTIPLFDSNIQKLLGACKKRGEIANRRVSSDGLNSQR
jgi:peptidoglycan hydrolase-like protein with peptidoglycan-binding domain